MRSFSSQANQRKPRMTVSEMLNAKYDDVHSQMYSHALSKYCAYAGIGIDDYRIIEMRGSYYDTPSRIQLINKTFPYNRKIVDLTPFWEDYLFKEQASYMLIDDETMRTAEVVFRDYARGYAVIKSRMTGVTCKIALKDVPEDMADVPDENGLEESFSYKITNKLYGV